jgi:fatty acid desaturase
MEEVEIPTEKLQEEIDRVREEQAQEREQRKEQEEKEGKERHWLNLVAISTAIFAVLAAVAALRSGQLANDALLISNEALLHETQAVDLWAEFQADSVKAVVLQQQVALLPVVGGKQAAIDAAASEAQRRKDQQTELQKQAQEQEKMRQEALERSETALRHHERYAYSVSLFQVAIGLGALAALTKLRPIWATSLCAGLIGLLLLVDGYVLFI